jgi:hypothetical protein
MSIDRQRLSRLANRKVAKEAAKPIPATCGECEYSFEHGCGYNSYVCDIDAEPIQLNKERTDCPRRRIPMQEAA